MYLKHTNVSPYGIMVVNKRRPVRYHILSFPETELNGNTKNFFFLVCANLKVCANSNV